MVRELVEGEVRSGGADHEPPGGGTDGGGADVGADGHVAEEEPAGDEAFVGAARRLVHDVQVGRVEAQGRGRQTVGDQVDPEQLDGDQRLGQAKGGRQEDGHHLVG